MNIQIFSYDELVEILQHKEHKDYNLIYDWFGDLDEDFKNNDGSYQISFGEDCVEVCEDDYFMIDHLNNYAIVLHNLDNLKDKIFKLTSIEKEVKE